LRSGGKAPALELPGSGPVAFLALRTQAATPHKGDNARRKIQLLSLDTEYGNSLVNVDILRMERTKKGAREGVRPLNWP
jgi:hypothetical protein